MSPDDGLEGDVERSVRFNGGVVELSAMVTFPEKYSGFEAPDPPSWADCDTILAVYIRNTQQKITVKTLKRIFILFPYIITKNQ
jgi:hypothetical protein